MAVLPLLAPARYLMLLSVRAIECPFLLHDGSGLIAKFIYFFHVSSDFLLSVVRREGNTELSPVKTKQVPFFSALLDKGAKSYRSVYVCMCLCVFPVRNLKV